LPWPRLGKLGGSLSDRASVKKRRDSAENKPAKEPRHDCMKDYNPTKNYTITLPSPTTAPHRAFTMQFYAICQQKSGKSTAPPLCIDSPA
jgi:hypothetical protein